MKKFFKYVLYFFGFIVSLIILLLIYFEFFYESPGCGDQGPVYKLKKDANELQMYLQTYEDRYGNYPSEEQGLSALVEKPKVGKIPKNYRLVVKNKMAILDPWGTPYILKFINGVDFQIITLGKDKKPGGEGKYKDFNILNKYEYPEEWTSDFSFIKYITNILN